MNNTMGFKEYRKLFDNVCDKRKNDIAFYNLKNDKVEEISYTDVLRRCRSFDEVVSRYGLKPGDRIAVAGYSPINCLLSFFAATYWNITVALPDVTLSEDILNSCIYQCECRLIISDRKMYDNKLRQSDLTVLDMESETFDIIYDSGQCIEYADRYDDVCTIVFSSGTGGYHNPVMVTYESLLIVSRVNFEQGYLSRRDTLLMAFPYYHIAAISTLFVFFFRCKSIYTLEKYEPEKTVEYLTRINPTIFGMIPKVFDTLISHMESSIGSQGGLMLKYYNAAGKISEFFISNLKIRTVGHLLLKPFYSKVFGNNIQGIISGGMRSTLSLALKVRRMGIKWYNTYSSTECNCPMVVTSPYDDFNQSAEGRIDRIDEIEIIIAGKDENGIGEVRVKTPMIMKGYFHNEELTKASFDENGYFKTGDLGYVDEKKYLHLSGRSRETIHLHNGEKVSPEFLEQIFAAACPENNPAIVCKIPSGDNTYDEIIVVFRDLPYTKEEKEKIRENFISSAVMENRYPVKEVRFVKSIPTTAVGKIKRSILAETTEDIEERITEPDETAKEAESAFDYFIELADEYLSVKNSITKVEKLSNTGLDSLAVFSISQCIQEKFGLDIIPLLSDDMSMEDLKKAMSKPEGNNRNVSIRKIRKSEIREMAKMYAECMEDYPLYKAFYPDEKKRRYQMEYDAWFVLYQQFNYTYVDEDKEALISIKQPGDKNRNIIWLHLNPVYTFGALRWFSLECIRRINTYLKLEKEAREKYYNPETDVYLGNICIAKNKRSSGLFFNLVKQYGSERKIYFETHSKEDLELYLKLGATLHEAIEWGGITHYSLTMNQ